MGKGPFSFKRSSSSIRRRPKKFIGPPSTVFPSPPQPIRSPSPSNNVNISNTNTNSLSAVVAGGAGGGVKGKKKAGARLWMRFDRFGVSELVECDKNAIIRRTAIPARDLRILGPVFSLSSSILVSRDDSLSLPPVRHLDLNTSTNKLSKPSKPRFPGSNHKES
ncbi:hypothetical protein EV1_044135 [Malus domestica]